MSKDKEKKPINQRPVICVSLEYYNSPDEDTLEEVYDYVLQELQDKEKRVISLYEEFSNQRLMLLIFCDSPCDAASLVRSDAFQNVRKKFTSRDFSFKSSLLDYIKGDPVGIGP